MLAAQTLCDPVNYSLPGSSVRILQARILEWVAIPFSRGSSQPRDQTQVSCLAGRFFRLWATRESPLCTVKFTFVDSQAGRKGDSFLFHLFVFATLIYSNKDWLVKWGSTGKKKEETHWRYLWIFYFGGWIAGNLELRWSLFYAFGHYFTI